MKDSELSILKMTIFNLEIILRDKNKHIVNQAMELKEVKSKIRGANLVIYELIRDMGLEIALTHPSSIIRKAAEDYYFKKAVHRLTE